MCQDFFALQDSTFIVSIEFASEDGLNDEAVIDVDNVMLEKGCGVSEFNYVTYGGFDANLRNSSNTTINNSYYWGTNAASARSFVTGGALSDTAVKLQGAYNSVRYVSQYMYHISQDLEYYHDRNSEEFATNNGIFRIRVDVGYHQRNEANAVVVSHYFDFEPHCEGWQYAGGTIDTHVVENQYYHIRKQLFCGI